MESSDLMAHVLIVDDNPIMAETLSAVVEYHGHEAIVAYGGQEALNIIKTDRLDIILLDLMMPYINGFETLRRLRAITLGRELPVIVITAREEKGLKERVMSAGGSGFLTKPVDGMTLVKIIAAYTNGFHQISKGDGFALQSYDSSQNETINSPAWITKV